MRGPREAIHAAMLATTIRIERAVEGNIGRLVVIDDALRGINVQRGAQRRERQIQTTPAIIFCRVLQAFIATIGIARRTAPALKFSKIFWLSHAFQFKFDGA